jgi:tetratricopeptide (TPR) repeat protein
MVSDLEADDAVERACDLHEQALDRHALGDIESAEVLALEAADLLEQALGPHDADKADLANVLNALVGICVDAVGLERAERHGRRSVAIMEAVQAVAASEDLDPADRITLTRIQVQGLYNLGNALRVACSYAEAEPLLVRAVDLSLEHLDSHDPDLASSRNNLAMLYKYTGAFDQAEALYAEASLTPSALWRSARRP